MAHHAPQTADGSDQSDGSEAPKIVLTRRTVLVIFGCLLVAMFLSSLDQSIVGTALPTIAGDLGAEQHEGWIITAYLLAIAIVMPIYGKIGDLHGRRLPFLVAIALFVVGSTGSALSGSFLELVAWRSLQGLGAGGLVILSQAIIADVVSARDRGKFMGPMGAVFGIATVAGPLLGGWFTEGPGWRWCFWPNVAIGVLAFVIAYVKLRLPSRTPTTRFDWFGAVLLALGTAGIVFVTSWNTLTGATRYDWSDPWLISLLIATVALLVVFVLVELRVEDPLIPMRLFRIPTFAVSVAIALVLGMAMFAALSFLPTFLQMSRGMDPTTSGLMMLPMTVGVMITAIGSGLLITRTGRYKIYPILGMGISAVALGWLTRISADMSMATFSAMTFVLGLGLGLVMQTIVIAVQNCVPPEQVGVATSTNNFLREIGAAVGTSVFSTVFTTSLIEKLGVVMKEASAGVGAHAAGGAGSPAVHTGAESLTPSDIARLPEAVRQGVESAYADALAPAFWYLVPLAVVGFLIAFLMREITLSSKAGLLAEGVADQGGQRSGEPGAV